MTTKQYLAPDATGVAKATTPAIVSTADALIAARADGKMDESFLPPGVGLAVQDLPQTGALAAGDMVNVYDAGGGVATARKADASAGTGKIAKGFVLAGTAAPGPARIYFEGDENTAVSGLTPGAEYFLDSAMPGGVTAVAPTAAGSIVMSVGVAVSATKLIFEPSVRYVN